MTISQIESFLTLAKYLNFTQAADALFVTQPALSRSISSLEQEIGIQLFERNTRAVTLTPAGITFQEESAHVLEAYASSIKKAKLAEHGDIGTLKIGYLRDGSYSYAPDVILAFREKYPEITIEFTAMNHSEFSKSFEKGAVDIIFGNSSEITKGCSGVLFNSYRECAVVSKNHRLSSRDSISITELATEPFIVMSRSVSQPGHDSVFEKCFHFGFTPNIVDQAVSVPSLLMLVSCGYGVSLLSSTFESQTDSVCFIPLDQSPEIHQAIIWHSANKNPSIKYLVETARKYSSSPDIVSR